MARSPKRPRLQDVDEAAAAEEDDPLVQLVHRRLGDVKELVAQRKSVEDQLEEARGKLDKAVIVLERFRADSRAKQVHGDRNQNPAAPVNEEQVSGQRIFGGEDHHVRAKISPKGKKAAAAAAAAGPSPAAARSNKTGSASRPAPSGPSPADRGQENSSKKASEAKSNKAKGAVQREVVDLISMIRSQSKPRKLDVALPTYVPIVHKRKPRSLVLSPAIDHLCATSALDGVVNFWQITQDRGGFGLNLSHTVDCTSPGQRRWPEDLAWHPHGETLFAVYTADGGSQLSIIKTRKSKTAVKFLEHKPHEKGIINTIEFMPWSNGSQFVTGGCDHGVVLWTEIDKEWQPRLLHRTLHSSAVTGVGGIRNKNYIISSGMDRRVFVFDPSQGGTAVISHYLESKALGVAPNPADCNLVMVHIGTHGEQLKLFDIRARKADLHSFGWKQLHSKAQSGYISQSWSPDGIYCASGSTDPKIHVFDIRYNSKEPVLTLDAHQKRVFKAAWHPNLPLMLSISSDLFIGIHKIL